MHRQPELADKLLCTAHNLLKPQSKALNPTPLTMCLFLLPVCLPAFRWLINLAINRDCTALFESCHMRPEVSVAHLRRRGGVGREGGSPPIKPQALLVHAFSYPCHQ